MSIFSGSKIKQTAGQKKNGDKTTVAVNVSRPPVKINKIPKGALVNVERQPIKFKKIPKGAIE